MCLLELSLFKQVLNQLILPSKNIFIYSNKFYYTATCSINAYTLATNCTWRCSSQATLFVYCCKFLIAIVNFNVHCIEFTCINVDIETVANYCYLGMVLKFNGNFNLAINTLIEKAWKANFKIKKPIGLNNPCRLLEKLFDSLVTPILTYGSEVWGVDSTFKDSDPFEKTTY